MGSKMKPVIFSEQVASALRGWHREAKKHVKQGRQTGGNTPLSSRPTSPLHSSMSPVHLLQGYQASDFGNQVGGTTNGGGGEATSSASPSHQEVDDFNVNGIMYSSEIERDVEDLPQMGNRDQHEVHIRLSDFSFRQKDIESA